MDRKQKTRYLVAIYLIIAFLAVIFVLISLNIVENTWRTIFLNLATELIGAAFIFVVVNFLFFVDEWELSENIKKLLVRLETDGRPSAEYFFRKKPDLSSHINVAKKIDLCGVSRFGTLHRYMDQLLARLENNCEIRILIVDDNQKSAIETSGLRSKVNDGEYFSQQIKQTKKRIQWLHEKYRSLGKQGTGSLKVRLLPYPPSFGISAFNSDRRNGIVFIEIFPHKMPSKSPEFELTAQKDDTWYRYFVDQFEIMWSRAEPWDPTKELNREDTTQTGSKPLTPSE